VTDVRQLDLGFERHPVAGTRMVRRLVRYPYVVTNAFRLDANPADMLSVILQSASGAILAGDRLGARVSAGAGTAVHVRTAAAVAVHRMHPEAIAEEQVDLVVGAGAFLEFMPEPKILFAGSALAQRLRLMVDPDGTAIVADGFLTHDPEARGGVFRRLHATIEVIRPDATILAIDRFDISGAVPDRPRSRFACHGVLMIVRRLADAEQAALLSALTAATALEDLYAAASPLPSHAGIGLRCVARSGAALRSGLRAAWAASRLVLTGSDPGNRLS
jgi:urease accessory protein